jgi:hypothetical protein
MLLQPVVYGHVVPTSKAEEGEGERTRVAGSKVGSVINFLSSLVIDCLAWQPPNQALYSREWRQQLCRQIGALYLDHNVFLFSMLSSCNILPVPDLAIGGSYHLRPVQ